MGAILVKGKVGNVGSNFMAVAMQSAAAEYSNSVSSTFPKENLFHNKEKKIEKHQD